MNYTLKDHGDSLEKQAANFVNLHLPFYEKIWTCYIGNQGNNTKALIENYPDNDKRQKFWERCYTVLESAYLSFCMIESGVFATSIQSFEQYEEFNKSYISFFAHIGRINDNIIKASNILGMNKEYSGVLEQRLKEFYQARHIVIHGKTVPVFQDELGLVQVPHFYTNPETAYGWTDEHSSWLEGQQIEKEYVAESCERLFFSLIGIINNAFAKFYETIVSELKRLGTSIVFYYIPHINVPGLNKTSFNVYNIQFPVSQSQNFR